MAGRADTARANGRKGGRPKGSKGKATLSKELAREAVRQKVLEHLGPLLEAQIAHAQGLKYLVARHKTSGKFERLTESEMQRVLAGEESDHVLIEVWEKDPSVQAFTDLMNRTIDKPAEQMQAHQVEGEFTIKWQS